MMRVISGKSNGECCGKQATQQCPSSMLMPVFVVHVPQHSPLDLPLITRTTTLVAC